MPSPYTVARSKHATLTTSTVDTVALTSDFNSVEVFNRGAANEIWFTTDGTTPTVGGDNCYVVLPGTALRVEPSSPGTTTVQLLCVSANAYSVTGI